MTEAQPYRVADPTRRRVLAGLLASTVVPGVLRAQGGEPPRPPSLHILPTGQGRRNGANWANAAPFDTADKLVRRAVPGQHVLFGFPEDKEPFAWQETRMRWKGGGTADAPVHLSFGAPDGDGAVRPGPGIDDPPCLRMAGVDLETDEGRPNPKGPAFAVLRAGTAHLRVTGPVVHRAGENGVFKVAKEAQLFDLGFRHLHARRAGRVIDTAKDSHIDGFELSDCSARGLIRGFARFRSLDNAVFRDLDLDADFLDGGGGAVCQILAVTRGRNLRFERIRVANAVNALGAEERGSDYIQGDGIVLEEDTYNARIEDCHASDMGDGGFDLKTVGVQLIGCSATRCKLGIRIWSHHPDNLIKACHVREPISRPGNEGACIWLAGQVILRDCVLETTGNMPPFRFGKGQAPERLAELRMEGGRIVKDPETDLVKGAPGYLELVDVLLGDTPVSGRFFWTGEELQAL
ncbi:right-handed parallel beta-helix repeat-containing protein [Aliiroseovarius sp.]|uniref:right-handed parallel beta-helix repeat-containing protein n=1 Tax=Aliiroseovarius sp. TaxID=1872442 RepID=UPI003BA9AC4B